MKRSLYGMVLNVFFLYSMKDDRRLYELIQHIDLETRATNQSGQTILHLASLNIQPKRVKRILSDHLVDINASDNIRATALHYAVIGSPEILRLMLNEPDRNINAQSTSGYTPLIVAVMDYRPQAASLLLKESDIDVNLLDNVGMSALHWAAYGRHPDIMAVLLLHKEISIDRQDDDGWTPLYAAVVNKSYEGIIRLLRAGADPEIADQNGISPVIYAFQHHDLRALEIFSIFKEAEKMIYRAIVTHDIGAFKRFLIITGPWLTDLHENTLLHYVCWVEDYEMMGLLLIKDPSLITCVNKNGLTPLRLSIVHTSNGFELLHQFLNLAYGANAQEDV